MVAIAKEENKKIGTVGQAWSSEVVVGIREF